MIDRLEIIPVPVLGGLLVAAVLLLGLIAAGLFRVVGRAIARRHKADIAIEFLREARGPMRLLFPALFLSIATPLIPLPAGSEHIAQIILHLLVTGGVIWTVYRLMVVTERVVLSRFDVEAEDNLKARKIHTQIRLIRRILVTLLVIFGLSALLLSFESVRRIGTTLLASAGILGLIVGFAAQKTLGLVIAGLQVALAQPIRIDDVVVLEGEWGRIEEISLTYVVVQIWDLRRLVVPTTYFIEQPFQNWTRVSADILGSVMVYVDYTFPVPAMRQRLSEILDASALWDRKVNVLQVTDATQQTLELRALMSARSSPVLWDLRCEVREQLIEFVRDEYPAHLPRFRAEIKPRSAG